MIERVNTLEDIGRTIERGEPAEALYNPGEEIDLLVTYVSSEGKYSARVRLPLMISQRGNGKTLIDITDPEGEDLRDIDDFDGGTRDIVDLNGGTVRDPYRSLKLEDPKSVDLESPENPPYELPTAVVKLDDGILAIAPYVSYAKAA